MHIAAVAALKNDTAMISPLKDGFSIDIIYKPSIPDNITNLWFF